VKAEHLSLSRVKKTELFDFMKETRNKEEYRRASAIKQKLEGSPYRTIARNLDVNYRNVYNWIQEYKEYGLDGIRSKRNNAGVSAVLFRSAVVRYDTIQLVGESNGSVSINKRI
jgi:transposase-like protein